MTAERLPRDRFENRIVRDKNICGGEPVFKGTRLTLRTVLAVWRLATRSRNCSLTTHP